jgi:N-acetyl-anhydromuramyl-L-alanine amidase AmpD
MKITELKRWLPNGGPRGGQPVGVVLHATASHSAESSIAYAAGLPQGKRVSWHYIIDQFGKVTKCVPVGDVAWHCKQEGYNHTCIGIELVNLNDGRDPFEKAQIEALRELLTELGENIPALKWVTTHRLVQENKSDPKGFDFVSFMDTVPRFAKHRRLEDRGWNG